VTGHEPGIPDRADFEAPSAHTANPTDATNVTEAASVAAVAETLLGPEPAPARLRRAVERAARAHGAHGAALFTLDAPADPPAPAASRSRGPAQPDGPLLLRPAALWPEDSLARLGAAQAVPVGETPNDSGPDGSGPDDREAAPLAVAGPLPAALDRLPALLLRSATAPAPARTARPSRPSLADGLCALLDAEAVLLAAAPLPDPEAVNGGGTDETPGCAPGGLCLLCLGLDIPGSRPEDRPKRRAPDAALCACARLFAAALARDARAADHAAEAARLRSLVAHMPVLVAGHDAHGDISFWNRECELTTGFSAQEIVGDPAAAERLYPDPAYRDGLRRARARRGTGYRHWEWNLATRDGGTKRVAWSALEVDPPAPNLASWYVGIDLTERLRVQELVIRAKQEWERTFDSVPEVIVILDRTLAVRRLNLAAAQRIGLHPREVVGRSLKSLLAPPGRTAHADGAAAYDRLLLMAHSDTPQTEEMDLPGLDGHFLVTLSPYTLADEKRIGSILIARDVSRRRALEEQLRQSQRMEALGTLAGGIAHDFNTVIGVIAGYAEMLLEQEEEASPRARMLRKIQSAGERAKSLVAQVLAFSRQAPARPVEVRLGDLVDEGLRLVETAVPPGVRMSAHHCAEHDLIRADPTQVGQIVMNLCTNAFHALRGREGGVLEVSVEDSYLDGSGPPELAALAPGAYVRLGVRDTGRGMEAQVAERMFDPFYTTKRPGEGTGMGMSVVHGIVSRLKGGIVVRSAPDRGTAIGVYLPRIEHRPALPAPGQGGPSAGTEAAPDAAAESRAETNALLEPLGGGEAILLVNADAALAEAEAEILGAMGYAVRRAAGPQEALDLVRAGVPFDLAMVDLHFPGHWVGAASLGTNSTGPGSGGTQSGKTESSGEKEAPPSGDGRDAAGDERENGLFLAAALRRAPTPPAVILCATFDAIAPFDRAARAGVAKIITKPLFRDRLARSIREVLDARAAGPDGPGRS
jgi:PAS domain S-box-containing protein